MLARSCRYRLVLSRLRAVLRAVCRRVLDVRASRERGDGINRRGETVSTATRGPCVGSTPCVAWGDDFSYQWTEGTWALVLGYGSLYNHARPASVRYEHDTTHLVMRYVALRDISAGEELTIDYAPHGGPVWFEVKQEARDPWHATVKP